MLILQDRLKWPHYHYLLIDTFGLIMIRGKLKRS